MRWLGITTLGTSRCSMGCKTKNMRRTKHWVLNRELGVVPPFLHFSSINSIHHVAFITPTPAFVHDEQMTCAHRTSLHQQRCSSTHMISSSVSRRFINAPPTSSASPPTSLLHHLPCILPTTIWDSIPPQLFMYIFTPPASLIPLRFHFCIRVF